MSHYVLAVPTGFDDVASWAPFADDSGMGYRGMTLEGHDLKVMLRPSDAGLELVVDGVVMRTFRVGQP